MSTELAEKLSALVKYQLPDFVRDNYETFQAFIIAYYEFLEQDTEAQYNIQKAKSFSDIDETIDSFVDYFIKQYAYNIPESIFKNQQFQDISLVNDLDASKRALAKHLLNFHSYKGSEGAAKLLFRILFDDEISFYYPKEDIFKPSTSEWLVKKTVKIINKDNVTTYPDVVNGTLRGMTSGATAVIKEALPITGNAYYSSDKIIYEFEIEPGTITEDFTPNETVEFLVGNVETGNLDILYDGKILPVISSIEIDEKGSGYSIGNSVFVSASNYVFDFTEGNVNTYHQVITNPSPYGTQQYDFFGSTFDAKGEYLVIGAPSDESLLDTTEGTISSPLGSSQGAVYVYKLTNDGTYTYNLLYSVQNPNANINGSDNFGSGVAVDPESGIFVATAPSEDWGNSISNTSAIYTFDLNTGNLITTFSPYRGYSFERLFGDHSLTGISFRIGRHLDIHNGNIIISSRYSSGASFFANSYVVNARTGNTILRLSPHGRTSTTGNARMVGIRNNLVFSHGNVYHIGNGAVAYNISSQVGTEHHYVQLTDNYLLTSNIRSGNGNVYVHDLSTGSLVKTISPVSTPLNTRYRFFGYRFNLSGNILAVAALGGVSEVLVYDVGNNWSYLGNIGNPNYALTSATSDVFGSHVSVVGDYILIGAPGEYTLSPTSSGSGVVYAVDLYSENNLFEGRVSKVSPLGGIKEIEIIDSGNFETFEPGTLRVSAPFTITGTTFNGKYEAKDPLISLVLKDNTGNALSHGFSAEDKVKIQFTSGNIFSNVSLNFSNVVANVNKIDSAKILTIDTPPGYAQDKTKSSGNIILNSLIANLTPIIGAVTSYPGIYNSKESHIDDIKKLQDSNYYQEYSYVIRATQSSSLWADIIKKVLHPAGYKLFAEVYIAVANSISAVSVVPDNALYTTILTFLKLLVTDPPVIATSVGTNVVELSTVSRAARNTRFRIGPTYNTLERFKYDYTNLRIYDVGDLSLEFLSQNIQQPILIAPPDAILRGNSNIILNSTFDSSSNWSLESGFSITNGNLVATTATGNTSQSFNTAGNVKVMATFEVKSRSAGSVRLMANTRVGSNIFEGTARTAVGNYSEIFFVNAPIGNVIINAAGFTGNVDNVYVKVLESITN